MLVPINDLETITHQLTDISGFFHRKRILITGSSGFIGSWLSQGLSHLSISLNLEIELIFLSRKIDDKFKQSIFQIGVKNCVFIETDLSNNNLYQFESLMNVDFVFHTATTVTNLNTQLSDSAIKNAISGTENLISVIRSSEKPPVFIHLSSGAVYGNHSGDPKSTPENTKLSKATTLNSYGSIKIAIEAVVNNASSSGIIIGTNPRLFSFFGPLLPTNTHFAIGNFVGDAIHGKNIELTGSPNSSRSYLYVGDLIRKLILLSIRPTTKIIHIGSKNRINMLDLALTVKSIVNNQVDVDVSNFRAEANHYVPAVEKSNSYLEDYSEISLAEGLLEWKEWLIAGKINSVPS
jgi:dTDP-glucose 4,6-dehydratase